MVLELISDFSFFPRLQSQLNKTKGDFSRRRTNFASSKLFSRPRKISLSRVARPAQGSPVEHAAVPGRRRSRVVGPEDADLRRERMRQNGSSIFKSRYYYLDRQTQMNCNIPKNILLLVISIKLCVVRFREFYHSVNVITK